MLLLVSDESATEHETFQLKEYVGIKGYRNHRRTVHTLGNSKILYCHVRGHLFHAIASL